MKNREFKSVELTNCTADDKYHAKLNEILSSMKKSEAPYKGSIELEVEKNDGEVEVSTKKLENISDEAMKLFNELLDMAQTISKSGKEPNKVKTQVEVEKEI